MDLPHWSARRVVSGLSAQLVLAACASLALAQGPQVDTGAPPGVPTGGGKLGDPIGSVDAGGKLGGAVGASGPSAFENPVVGQPIGGRPGPSVSRAPIAALNPGQAAARPGQGAPNFAVPAVEAAKIPSYGVLETEKVADVIGPPDGMTLDAAIELLIRNNLSIIALRFEIPMAQADVLTAGLRVNPIFYADTQLIPYGHYSNQRPGGQKQYDVNITYPLDVTFKRKARIAVAERAKRVTEAQLQDAVRNYIDNLYTVYVDVVAATETLEFTRKFLEGITRRYSLAQAQLVVGAIEESKVDALRAQVEQAQLQVREASEALVTKTRNLALLLNIPPDQAETIKVRSTLRDLRELPESAAELIQRGLTSRPDLAAYRLGVLRSQADVRLARANRYTDVYVLYQPYTLQDNTPLGLKSAYSWALGVTANVPIYNRNQGNVARAELNARQTRVELAALERQVAYDVDAAVREFNLSRTSVLEYEREVLPASRRVFERTIRRFEVGEASPEDYLEAQREYNEVFRQYREALVRHRRSMLDLNTAVGARVLP
jgi:outer membrane protein, heavy metal efflux system